MLSDAVLDLYIKGLYTSHPKLTYMLPPKKSYMRRLAHEDHTYRQISKEAYQKTKPYPHFYPSFGQNVYSFAILIDNALQKIN